jgi:hypothetical protein
MEAPSPRTLKLTAALAAVATLSACGETTYRTYPSPDGEVALVYEIYQTNGALGTQSIAVHLQGRDESRRPVGTFYHSSGEEPHWLDDEQVVVCDLVGAPDVPTDVMLPGGANRPVRIRILQRCASSPA